MLQKYCIALGDIVYWAQLVMSGKALRKGTQAVDSRTWTKEK